MMSAHPGLSQFLERIVRRSELKQAEKSAVLSLSSRPLQLRQNAGIIRPGDKTDEATLVAKGLVGRFDSRRNGDRQLTAVYIPGDMCDLHSVPVPQAGWGLVALSPCTILKIPHAEIRKAALDFPALSYAFWRDTIVDGSILSKWVSNLGRREAKPRLAHFLCEMGMRFETVDLGSRTDFTLDMSQAQLAEVIGVTAVHLNRTLQELRSEGLITSQQRRIEVSDWEALCRLAEFDPTYLLLARQVPRLP